MDSLEMHRVHQTSERGITLIELLVVVAIVGILAAIAVPSYLQYVQTSARAEAEGILLEAAQFLERNYTLANRYDLDNAGNAVVLPAPLQTSPKQGTTRYNIAVAFGAAPSQTFTLTATPTAAFPDADCGALTLTHTGVKGEGGSKDVAFCWKQ
jgi:type IV pilus assembly protein PilE